MHKSNPSRVLTRIDAAAFRPGTCRQTIESTFAGLRTGEALEVIVAHDPAPLRRRFAQERPGQSVWTYLQNGPAQWRVRVERVS